MAGVDWVWHKGEFKNTCADEAFWAYWVNQGVAKYVAEWDLPSEILTSLNDEAGIYTRPLKNLDDLSAKHITIKVPETGAFNPGLVEHGTQFIMVYRPDEYSFAAVVLDKAFKPISFHPLKTTNCADPRLIWYQSKLLMVYSSIEESVAKECIRGQFIMEGNQFIDEDSFKISPEGDRREKNWMPFIDGEKLYFIGNVCPHTIYEWDGSKVKQAYQTAWDHPWFYQAPLRGNTNAVRMPDGNFLATFHTAKQLGRCSFYDNGAYVFGGKPPFKVLKCANRTYLPAEAAIEPHFRKKGLIRCPFPVGMVLKKNRLFISYGDNDSCCKIMETTLPKMLKLLIETY